MAIRMAKMFATQPAQRLYLGDAVPLNGNYVHCCYSIPLLNMSMAIIFIHTLPNLIDSKYEHDTSSGKYRIKYLAGSCAKRR